MQMQPIRHLYRAGVLMAAVLTLGLLSALASAQPRDPLQRMGETVMSRGSAYYRFEGFTLASPDGTRRWRVNLGIPEQTPPANGFPVLYMLDGNAALMNFDEALLADLARSRPHVLAFIGYDNDLRIDSAARTRDYTPRLTAPDDTGRQSHNLSGGADAFLDLIERRIRPAVAARVPLDPNQQTLWGHSFGGVFVMHALFTRTGAFQTYAAGSPSMWWHNGHIERESMRFAAHNAGNPARVLIHLGGEERRGLAGNRSPEHLSVRDGRPPASGAPSHPTVALAARLGEVPGVKVEYREFEGLGHGPMFRASLMATLHAIAGTTERVDRPETQDAGVD